MVILFGLDYLIFWFFVIGGLFSGYVIFDGFDLGVGVLYLFFKKEKSWCIVFNVVGLVWDGNEVWFVIGGGVFFVGFLVVYVSLFLGMYILFMLFFLFFIFRVILIEF